MTDKIEVFLNVLDDNDIDYVHWKSNTNIEKALSGEDDLDILVDPNKKQEVYKLFKDQNIIRGYSEKDSWQNEIFHYFGMDIYKKKLVHIHLHFLLEVGYDFDKSVNLPIVDKYIKEKIKYKYIYIPIVEHEYIVLIIRLLLKNAFIPYLLMLPLAQLRVYKNQKKGIVTGNAYNEFVDLKNRIDRDRLDEMLEKTFAFLDKSFFYECEKVIDENSSLKSYFYSSKKLGKMLSPYRYHSDIVSFFISFYRINQGRINKIIQNQCKSKKLPENGGRIFAFVGGDGAGKSSNIEILDSVLNKHFCINTIHLGRPKKLILGTSIRIIGKVLRIFGFQDIGNSLTHLAKAIERKKAFQKAKKIKAQGGIVIMDRLPLDGVTSMDCPRIHTIKNNKYGWLSKIEKKLYSTIKGVDELIVLKLDPQIAIKRRPEDDEAELLIRSGQIWDKDFSKINNAHVLDTSNSFDYIEENILTIIWKSLNEK